MMSKTLQLSNNRIAHYFEQGEGEPLVLIHGVGMQAAAWYPQIEYFSKHYHVISVDMRDMVKVPNYQQKQNYKILLNGPSNLLQP